MRWVAVLVVTALGLGLAAAGVFLLRGDDPQDALPDLDPTAPIMLEIVEEGDSYRLFFATGLDNVGAGPLLIEGERPNRDAETMAARQLVRRTDGSERALAVPGALRYVEAESGGQWRLPGFEAFELRRAGNGRLVERSEQSGSCVGDGRRVEGREPSQPVWTDRCGRNQPGLLVVRAGISPGYGYEDGPGTEGRYIDVTNLAPGRYVLVHVVNPKRSFEEAGYENNAGSVLIQLRRSGVIPTVRVVTRCPRSETCPRRD